jgi:multidrug resistance protein MdtO
MASQDATLPAIARSKALDEAWAWFWQFLRTELSPYPGRAWVVGRITISATITMVLVMTFRIPYGFLGVIYTLFLSRENPRLTFVGAVRTTIVYATATIYTIIGVMTLVADPLTHFLWIVASIFLAFYLISIVPDYFSAVGFGFTLAAAIPLWDQTNLSVQQRTENTLWLGFVVVVGAAVTVVVEYAFRRVHPITDITQSLVSRLQAVEDLLRQIAADQPIGDKLRKDLQLYSALGMSRVRRQILRSNYPKQMIAQMNIAAGLLGRLTDLSASLVVIRSTQSGEISATDCDRCLRLANQLAEFRRELWHWQLPSTIDILNEPQPSSLPLLPEMERTAALIPQAFSGSENIENLFRPSPLEPESAARWIVADALTNPDHLKFAIRGTLATMLAYVFYQTVNWPGISTAIPTCIITALSTIGSSRQKQFLRLGGAIVGGFIFGFGAQVFVLPYLDSIAGFAVLFAIVTAIAAWIATATPRLSYLGVQLALAWYLINLQEFTIQSSLSIARDRVVGVLLGLMCMWLVFDRLWVRDALQEMQGAFIRNLQLFAELVEQATMEDRERAAKRALQLRDQINAGFDVMRAQADAVLFEFGPSRARKLKIRDDFRHWQPTLGALLQIQITGLQYLYENRFSQLPPAIADTQAAFEKDMAAVARAMAEDVAGNVSSPAPDVQESALRLQQTIKKFYESSSSPIPPPLVDMITIAKNLASIATPLYRDIHATFAPSDLS